MARPQIVNKPHEDAGTNSAGAGMTDVPEQSHGGTGGENSPFHGSSVLSLPDPPPAPGLHRGNGEVGSLNKP